MLWHLQDSDLPVNAPLTQRRILIGWVTVTGTNGVFLWIPCFLLGYKFGFGGIFDGINLLYTVTNLTWSVFFPHIFVWGSCFWFCTSACPLPLPPAAHTQLTHTQLAHTQLAHTQVAHTQLTHTQLVNTQLAHSHNLSPHNLLTHNLHTTCPHTTYSHTTSQHTTCHHTTCSHTTSSHTQLVHTHTPCVAGVALGDMDGHSVWQPWHLATWTCTLRGRCGTYGTGMALVASLVPSWRRGRCRCLRGRRGTWRHRPSLCVGGMALVALGWLWWRDWFPVDAVVAAAVCVAGVALGDIDLHFAWHVWHLATSTWRHRPSHTTFLSHNPFTHNFVTHNSFTHTQLCHTHTTLSHTTLSHTTLSHTTLLHTTLSHTTLSHTTLLHKLTHTRTHTQHCHKKLFHPTCLAPSPFLPAFPISFSHLLDDHGKKLTCGVFRSFNFWCVRVSEMADLV